MRKAAALPVLLVVAVAIERLVLPPEPGAARPARAARTAARRALRTTPPRRSCGSRLVWGVAAPTLGLYARWAGIERLPAALLFAVGIGTYAYLQTGVSVAVVRQISARAAFDVADRPRRPSTCPR